MRTENKILLFGILSFLASLGVFDVCHYIITIAYGSGGDETMCNQIMYSDNWTLGYLRNVSAICSNGG